MISLNYRRCGLEDLELLREIAIETFYQAFAQDNEPINIEQYLNKNFNRDKVRKDIMNQGSEFYFALNDNDLIGYFKINPAGYQTDLNYDRTLELERIYVLADYQNHGYGKKILEKVIEIGKEEGAGSIWLGVWENNIGAIRFYERYGFVKFDEHSFYMGDEEQVDYLMRLNLK